MTQPLRLRLINPVDLPFADRLRDLAGWNQTMADWRRFLAAAPDGCFLAEWEGVPAGTAVTVVYGSMLAWIGMVLVQPEYRRQGIGQALLDRCIKYLRGRAVRCIKLDATPLGKKVYDGLGFKDEWTLSRWVLDQAPTAPVMTDPKIAPWVDGDLGPVDEIDASAFGVSRESMLYALARQSRFALVARSEPGRIDGYGLLRKGSKANYLGPVVAASPVVAEGLIETLISRIPGEPVFWDIPDQNSAAVALATRRGFTIQRTLTRMFLGENSNPGNPRRQFAIAGPEVG